MRFIFIIFIFLLACSSPSPKDKLLDKVDYQLISLGDGNSPKSGEVIQLSFIISTNEADTLYFVPDYSYFLPIGNHLLDSIWQKFNVGDSLNIKMHQKDFNSYLKLFKVMQSKSDSIILKVRIENSLDSLNAYKVKQELLSRRELEEQKQLKGYIASLTDSIENLGGVYRQKLNQIDSANQIQMGSEVSIHYKGSFLNGYVFDNTFDKDVTPSFTYGQEYQMIDGLKTALKGMKEGENLKIILPSRHAFGEEGSLAGIVPPYTAVIYDVNIIKVIN